MLEHSGWFSHCWPSLVAGTISDSASAPAALEKEAVSSGFNKLALGKIRENIQEGKASS